MNLTIILIELLLAIFLFLLMNLKEIKNLNRIDNIIIPNIYLILVSSLLPKLKNYVILILFFYLTIDFIFVFLITKRGLFKNLKVYYQDRILVLILGLLSYQFFLLKVTYAFVDMDVFKNFIWVLILIYGYQKLNVKSIKLDSLEEQMQEDDFQEFVVVLYAKLKNKYGYLIKSDSKIEEMLYSFMIYETYLKSNHFVLYLKKKYINKEHSYGIMQVESNEKINDEESIVLMKEKLESKLSKLKRSKDKDEIDEKLIKEKYKTKNDIKEIEKILKIIKEFKNNG